MHNVKYKLSAITALIVTALFIGLLIMFNFFMIQPVEGGDTGEALGMVFFLAIFHPYALFVVNISIGVSMIINLIFGLVMLKSKSGYKLDSRNKRLFAATCALLLFVGVSLYYMYDMYEVGLSGLPQAIYTIVCAVAYVAGLIMQIVSMIILKTAPEVLVTPSKLADTVADVPPADNVPPADDFPPVAE